MHVVWLKRDLRLRDHRPLWEASRYGKCLILYVYEPELLHAPDFDSSHQWFIQQSLDELDRELQSRGNHITYRYGSMPQVLQQLHQQVPITKLWSHTETGTRLTFDRDLRVAAWCKSHQIPWQEYRQTGAIRRLKSREGWAERWESFMALPILPTPERINPVLEIDRERPRSLAELGLPATTKVHLQPGGEAEALRSLITFLDYRGKRYHREMSSPVTASRSCSRLSTHLAWGTISMRQVLQATRQRQQEVKAQIAATAPIAKSWLTALRAFDSRLHWHCHFVQKLESKPALEFENIDPRVDGLREAEFNEEWFTAWCEGKTGYPLIDACMRCLHQTGWINFRMRAMLVSFAGFHLWLHWRQPALYLARHFLDYEPGIHYAQFQMQSGTSGHTTIRMYSPVKQLQDQDPDGIFVRHHLPELGRVPTEYLAEPHLMPLALQRACGCWIGQDYPAPIVDHRLAYRQAREKFAKTRPKRTKPKEPNLFEGVD